MMINKDRLTDVDVLIRTFSDIHCAHYDITYEGIIRVLKDAPVVDAVEVVHARWIKGDGLKNTKFIPCSGILYCSNCKNEAYWDTDYGQQKFDYCPNCGAKMDAN